MTRVGIYSKRIAALPAALDLLFVIFLIPFLSDMQ